MKGFPVHHFDESIVDVGTLSMTGKQYPFGCLLISFNDRHKEKIWYLKKRVFHSAHLFSSNVNLETGVAF